MRNAKTLGLAFVAVLALGVAAAPAASADVTDFWADDGAVKIDATGESVQKFSIGSLGLTCPHVEGDAVYKGESSEITGENIEYDPNPHECHVVVFGITFPVEVHENGCHFKFTGGTFTTGPEIGHGSLHITGCTVGSSITITVLETNTEDVRCEFHVPEQTIPNITYSRDTIEETKAVTIEANEVPVETTVTNGGKIGCSKEETTTATYDGDVIAKATNEFEEYVDTTVTGTATG